MSRLTLIARRKRQDAMIRKYFFMPQRVIFPRIDESALTETRVPYTPDPGAGTASSIFRHPDHVNPYRGR